MSPVAIALVTVAASAVVGGLLKVIAWTVGTAVDQRINGRLDRIDSGLNRVTRWTESHDRRHGHEQTQLIDALDRAGISPPDGWSR